MNEGECVLSFDFQISLSSEIWGEFGLCVCRYHM